ncbi:MAG: type I-B CRISPR-associated protein Cas7/Cst2/DevR [Fusobacterium sp.]|uniref:type I-B CRISPR-associated protein Cas7/Cst2/DevR n=1 Tax=Fusobacterium sp. TaxID=68766 RepID=UPI002943F2B9|nr:type I-B CRISPR-associated protein Cas7/Cst2/DevR [Fusobacterium sp.]MDY3058549.1 type I-B CRISPR-associated protein Cas7/Cst2/DevR [Fusobacterium sp.]
MLAKGLTMTIVFEAESANYGEGIGNITALKKLSRGNGSQYTYISRQAIRYNIVEQLGEAKAEVEAMGSGEKKVVQFSPETTIKDYPELDFFGYLKTEKDAMAKKRSAIVRLSNAISTETFKGDLDFLTNIGLADRTKEKPSIAQAEIHKSYYVYTLAMDLDQIGIDKNDDIELPKEEKSRRVEKLLDTIAFLYRDIRGRRENLAPLFVIGGVYDIKNPIFENLVKVKENKILVKNIDSGIFENMRKDTFCGVVEGKFDNTQEIEDVLNSTTIPKFFEQLKTKVREYYEIN